MTRHGLGVELRHVDLHRGDRAVLHDINWTITPGQRWVLTGDNGAGKTQLMKLVSGALWPTPTGRAVRRYLLEGEVFEAPAGVLDEIAYIGAERQDRYERYGWNFTAEAVVGTGLYRTDIPLDKLSAADRRESKRVLAQLSVAVLAKRRFLTLSYGERRLVLLARAMATRPRLLLLDEATNGLDAEHHGKWLRWLEATVRTPLTWVLSTHQAADIPACVTHALTLQRGRIVSQQPAKLPTLRRVLARAEAARATCADLPQRRLRRHVSSNATSSTSNAPLVRLRQASVFLDGHPALRSVSMTVRPGDFWVITGANGSGKTTLLRTLYGDHGVADSGSIERCGVTAGVPLDEFKQRIAYVAPHLQTDQPRSLTVLEVVASGRYASIGLNEALTPADRTAAQRALRVFDAQHLATRRLAELSYGQLRRVLFARGWVGEPRFALLDEPFAGLDPVTRADLLDRVERFVAAGGACVLATHNTLEWPRRVTGRLRLRVGKARRF